MADIANKEVVTVEDLLHQFIQQMDVLYPVWEGMKEKDRQDALTARTAVERFASRVADCITSTTIDGVRVGDIVLPK